MPKPDKNSNNKNLISQNLIALRRQHGLSQSELAARLQLAGCNLDKHAITRIETNNRYVSDIELKAIKDLFDTTYEELLRPKREEVL